MMNCILEVRDLSLEYEEGGKRATALHRVNFSVASGERLVILGSSGCGKSSLLNVIAGFIQPSEGEVLVEGVSVRAPGPDRLMVFQGFDQLLPWKTVRENIVFALVESKRSFGKDAVLRANDALGKVRLLEFSDHYPHMLSGGMKQRVALARALAVGPRILLMDEPFAALDALTRGEMQRELLQLWEENRFTMLFVTHSIQEAMVLGSRILLLSPRPGRVRAALKGGQADPLRAQQIEELLFGKKNVEDGILCD